MIHTKALAVFVVAVLVIVLAYVIYSKPTETTDFGVAPDLAIPVLSGKRSIHLSDLRGRPVLLVFWTSDIERCREDVAQLQILYKKYHRQGLEVIGIATDDVSSRNYVVSSLRQIGATFPNALSADIFDLGAKYDYSSVPYLFVIDQQGKIVDRLNGLQTAGRLDQEIRRLVAVK